MSSKTSLIRECKRHKARSESLRLGHGNSLKKHTEEFRWSISLRTGIVMKEFPMTKTVHLHSTNHTSLRWLFNAAITRLQNSRLKTLSLLIQIGPTGTSSWLGKSMRTYHWSTHIGMTTLILLRTLLHFHQPKLYKNRRLICSWSAQKSASFLVRTLERTTPFVTGSLQSQS